MRRGQPDTLGQDPFVTPLWLGNWQGCKALGSYYETQCRLFVGYMTSGCLSASGTSSSTENKPFT